MLIAERPIGDVMVLNLSGRMIVGEDPGLVTRKIDGLHRRAIEKILLDMAAVPSMDDAGIDAIKQASGTGGSLKLLHLNEQYKKLPDLSRFESFDSEDEALRSFAQQPGN